MTVRVKGDIRYRRREVSEMIADIKNDKTYRPLFTADRALYGEIIRVAKEFLAGLGKSDAAGQSEYCEIYTEKFSQMLAAAQNDAFKKSGLYLPLWCLFGAAITVIML